MGHVVTGSERVRAELAPDPSSVRRARRLVSDALRSWELEHLEDVATLLVSELATNAVLHARSGFAVEVKRSRVGVRVAVQDCSPSEPARRHHGPQAATGRGLALMETLSTSWGSGPAPRPYSKAVWFELAS